jgi:8-oxo-dGTP pyrophosphatase MutT (NUDIX family)
MPDYFEVVAICFLRLANQDLLNNKESMYDFYSNDESDTVDMSSGDFSVLMLKSKGKDLYYLPGGKIDAGESLKQAAIREVNEELGIDLNDDNLSYLFDFKAASIGKGEKPEVLMHCFYADKHIEEVNVKAEIEDYFWCDNAEDQRLAPAAKILMSKLNEPEGE